MSGSPPTLIQLACTPESSVEQLVLIGQPRPIRVPERRWQSWLNDAVVVALRGQALQTAKWLVLSLDWRTLVHRPWLISGRKSSWTVPTRHCSRPRRRRGPLKAYVAIQRAILSAIWHMATTATRSN